MEDLGTLLEDGEPIESEEIAKVVDENEDATEDIKEEPEKVEKNEPDEPTSPEVEEPESKSVPIQALMAEREKRQALELQIANSNKDRKPAPDIFEDQEAYTKHFQQQIDNDRFNDRANQSEFYAQREYGADNLALKLETFKELKTSNPALEAQVLNAVSPYHEIVDIVNKHEKMEKMQNIDEWEAKTKAEIEAKVRAEIKAEIEGKANADKSLRDSIPTSLVDEPSKGTINKPTWTGPSALDQILD